MWIDEHCLRSRGYGIHSPFLYRIVREAMMPRHPKEGDSSLYEALRGRGVGRRTATRLHNLFVLEGYTAWSIDSTATGGAMMVATPECSEERTRAMAAALGEQEGVLCILHPIGNCARRRLCRRLTKAHHSMSAEKRAFTLLFSRNDLQKQHIRI